MVALIRRTLFEPRLGRGAVDRSNLLEFAHYVSNFIGRGRIYRYLRVHHDETSDGWQQHKLLQARYPYRLDYDRLAVHLVNTSGKSLILCDSEGKDGFFAEMVELGSGSQHIAIRYNSFNAKHEEWIQEFSAKKPR
jgi:hypothetical protein